nr:lysine-rich arabinogalactan protein 18-like [Rhipicephalus microplus]
MVADALSRLPAPAAQAQLAKDEEIVSLVESACVTKEELNQAVLNGGCLRTVKSFVLGSWPPQKSIPEEAKSFYSVREELSVVDDLLLRSERLRFPSSLTAQLITVAHEAHPGITRTKARLHGRTWNASKISRVRERGTSPPYQRSELPAPQLPVQVPQPALSQPALPPPPSPGSQPPPPGVLQSAVPQSPAPDPQLPVPEPAMLHPPSPESLSRSPGVLQSSTSSLPSPAVQHSHRPSRELRPPVWLKDYQTH